MKNKLNFFIKEQSTVEHLFVDHIQINRQYNMLSPVQKRNEYQVYAHHPKPRNDLWNHWIACIQPIIAHYTDTSIDSVFQEKLPVDNPCYQRFYQQAVQVYRDYLESQYDQNSVSISVRSFLELMRYFPAFDNSKSSLFIDSDIGLFGAIIKEQDLGTLSFLFKDDGEITYSFVKKEPQLDMKTGRKKLKMIRIRGVAYFTNELNLSNNIFI